MLPRFLILGLILLHFTPTLEGHLHYAVIFPSEFQGLQPQTACLSMEGAKELTSIKLTLQTNKENTTLIQWVILQDYVFSCLPFDIPNPTENNEVATMCISIDNSLESIYNETKVLLKKQTTNILVQTDKHVYKPGQTVNFRVMSLKENLQADTRQIKLIELKDPEKNRIGQWLNVSPKQGISEFSFGLSKEPILGDYTITVDNRAHHFGVEEYVLPRFEVSMEFPPVILFNCERFPVKVCARYTYGKSVQGVLNGSVCRKRYTYMWGWRAYQNLPLVLCQNITGKLDRSGCASIELESDHFNMTRRNFEMRLQGQCSVTEDGTGIELSTSSGTKISNILERVTFIDADSDYKPGIPYSGKLKAEDAYGHPLSDKLVYISYRSRNNDTKLTLVTDQNGFVSFTLEDTSSWEGRMSIIAKTNLEDYPYKPDFIQPEYGYAHLSLLPFYSPSKSFLSLQSETKNLPCEGQQEVQVEYLIKHTELNPDTKKLHLHYLASSKASIRTSGTKEILVESLGEDLTGTTSFNLPLSYDISPSVRVLVYILLPDGEMIADSAKFTVQRCFKNKVSVGFSPDEVLPGSDVSLKIQADPGSLCGLRVVDQSVVLMKPEKELTADKVHALFPFNDFGGFDYRIEDRVSGCGWRFSRSIIFPGFRKQYVDVYSLFRDMKLKILTSADIKQPVDCLMHPQIMKYAKADTRPTGERIQLSVQVDSTNNIPEEPVKPEKVRQYFPETWMFQLSPTGDSGSVELHEKAPDTITDWNAGAVCMGPSGFGLSPPASLRVFQPYFAELSLPYSVNRDESFLLKCTIFNYLKDCIMVQVSLAPTKELDEQPCDNCPRSSCLCADESKTFYWNLKATKPGEYNIAVRTEAVDTKELCHNEQPIVPKEGSIDIVIKPLLVQPGGILVENAHSSLLCVQGEGEDHSKTEQISLTVPENIIADSARAYIAILGDLMGSSMQNLDRLLAMPYGCGEQNMVLFVPNILILEYLTATHQPNEAIQTKAKGFLQSGYQRQLTYKRDDGSYSAFGKNDQEGNTWLTAFVVKSFNKARPYILIDETHLKHSFTWLKNHRDPNGCFQSVGRLFNNAMKGGVDDVTSLSTYVTIALIESGLSKEDSLVGDALSCLKGAAVNVTNVYTQALLANLFTLAGEMEIRQILLEKLEKQAVRKAGQLHWERPSTKPSSELPFWYRAPSAEVELTSYMLMTELSGPEKDLGRASEMVNWLCKQQNPNGGFSSTQDTVVALQAMAQYARATFSDAGDITVTVRSQTEAQEFHVDNINRLLLQTMPLPDIPGDYTLTATGSGCVYVQTVLRYNVPPPKSDATFAISVEVKPDQCSGESVTKLQIHITAQYTGSREKSNMALIEFKMLSGFFPVKSSVRELEKSKLIKRSEIQTDMVTLYLEELGHKALDLYFTIEQDAEVKNLKPASMKIYDYYETGEYALTEYNSPCGSDVKTTKS